VRHRQEQAARGDAGRKRAKQRFPHHRLR
jgi:hypothetical protein